MSLRAFHFFFIAISILLSAGLSYFGVNSYLANQEKASLFFGVGSAFACVSLIVYGIWFLRKSRKLIL